MQNLVLLLNTLEINKLHQRFIKILISSIDASRGLAGLLASSNAKVARKSKSSSLTISFKSLGIPTSSLSTITILGLNSSLD